MFKDCRILKITPSIYSLHFEKGFNGALTLIKQRLSQLFPELIEITNSFNRINLIFPNDQPIKAIKSKLSSLDLEKQSANFSAILWEIPICFDPVFTNDLDTLFEDDLEAVSRYRHDFLATTFTLELYGFLPGFCYLSGLPKVLQLDRKTNPNALTLKGTVGVGGAQVGVYPQDSPGGWQNIGNCPLPWINFTKTPYTFVAIGDKVCFYEVDLAEHKRIEHEVAMGRYQPKSSSYDKS